MFRNVTGVHEAVEQQRSEDSLVANRNSIRIVKDIQSDSVAQTYAQLKIQWNQKRDELKENLEFLQGQENCDSDQVEHVQTLIQCLNSLIDNGEMSQHCQTLIERWKSTVEPVVVIKKSLTNQMIRLPRHATKTVDTQLSPLERLTSDLFHLSQPIDIEEKGKDFFDIGSTSVVQSGIEFYAVAQPFRSHRDQQILDDQSRH